MNNPPTPPQSNLEAAVALAVKFHEIYERLAPSFGYETRAETKKFYTSTPNGMLMIAVCGEIQPLFTALEKERDEAKAIIKNTQLTTTHEREVVSEVLKLMVGYQSGGNEVSDILDLVKDWVATEKTIPEGEHEGADGLEDVLNWTRFERDDARGQLSVLKSQLESQTLYIDGIARNKSRELCGVVMRHKTTNEEYPEIGVVECNKAFAAIEALISVNELTKSQLEKAEGERERLRDKIREARDFQTPTGGSFTDWYDTIVKILQDALTPAKP